MVSLISEIHDDLEKGALRLMTEYRARLFVEAVRLCEDKVEAEDLVSRTFSKAIFNLDSYKEDDNLYGWMKTIMVNIHRNDLARPVARGTTPVSSDALEMYAGADNSTDEQILKDSDHDVLREAIDQLDPEYRKMVSLYYYNELSLKEIASFSQTSTSSVSRKLEIARKIIAAKVGSQLGKKPVTILLAVFLGIGTLFGAWKAVEVVWPKMFCHLWERQSPVVEMSEVGMSSEERERAADEAVMPMNLKSEKQEEMKMNTFARCATAAAMLAASSAVTAVHADNVNSTQALGAAHTVFAAETVTGVTRYVNHSGSDETQTGGTSIETAFATVAAAVEASSDGDVILIESSAEPYTVPSNIVISTGITIKGQSGNPEDVVVCRPATATSQYRVFMLDNNDALLQDLTIAGGHTHVLRENGGGVCITAKGGRMYHCVVTGCTADYYNSAGGIFIASGSPGIVDRCVVTNCTCAISQDQFGGSALAMEGGTVRNSLLVDNHLTTSSAVPGGTVHMIGGVLESCTIAGNDSAHCAGVYVYRNTPMIRNCLIGACSSSNDSAPGSVWSGTASCFQNCVAEAYINDSCGEEKNVFVDASSGNWYPALRAVDAVETSEDWMSDALDLSGNARIRGEKCDIGCYECDPDGFMASLGADVVNGLEPLTVKFTLNVKNAPGDVTCQYDWNGDGEYEETTSELTVEHQFAAGTYQVKAKVVSGQLEYAVPGCIAINVGQKTIHVAEGESLSAALDGALDGTEIVLAKGTHDIGGEVFVRKNVVIRGATGNPEDVTVRRPATAASYYRVFTLDNSDALLQDITIAGGLTHVLRENGGGVCITANGGRMYHCVVTGCMADYYNSAGGIFIASGSPGIVDRCVVTNCTCAISQDQFGGSALAMEGGTVRNSLLVDNHLTTSAAAPGGTVHISGGVLENCTIAGNDSAHCAGVYVYRNTPMIRNCLIGACSSSNDSAPDSVWSGAASCFQNCVAEAYINDSCGEEKNAFVNASSGNWYPVGKAVDAVKTSEDWMSDAMDLAGNERICGEKCDIGCYEADPNVFSASLSTDIVSGLEPLNVKFTLSVQNAPGGISCQYDWNGDGVYEETTSELTVEHQFTTGTYQVKAKVISGLLEYVVPSYVAITVGQKTIQVAEGESLSAALDAALDGAEIVLAKGTYNIDGELFVRKDVVIRGATGNPEDVIVRRPESASENYRVFTLDNGGALLQDITIAGGRTHVVYENGAGVSITAKGGRMYHCIVTGCVADWYNSAGGVFIALGSPAVVDRCVISNCTNNAVQNQFGGSAIAMEGGTVRNSLIVGTCQTGAVAGGAVYVKGGSVENCTIVGNEAVVCAGVVTVGSAANVVNCVIASNAASGAGEPKDLVWSGEPSVFSACISDSVRINETCHQADADLIFKSVPKGNYRLTQCSPARNKGDVLAWMADGMDLDGNKRILFRKPDLGCYECLLGLGMTIFIQ